MEPGFPTAEAVAVRDGRILAVGSLQTVTDALGDEPFEVDETLRDHVVLPGLIDQHLHPLLGATTLAMDVIATEDWVLPDRTFPAARSHEEYLARLRAAEEALDPDEWLTTWGYHSLWHGHLDRAVLDEISATRPIVVWQRSCHELYLNSAAISALDITAESVAGRGPASDQIDLDAGHFWEAGFFNVVMGKVAPHIISPERIERGLHQLVAYLHQHGVTAINEPGIAWGIEPFELYQQILGADDAPFRTSFLVDGRTQAARGLDPGAVVDDALEQIARAPHGKVSLLAGQVKMFADGAIISQLMQMREPYLDAAGLPDLDHHGEWMVEPDVLETYFRIYWDAGWQIHTHVNGDLGLDVLLDIIERCMIATPRADHRSVIVHFANSTEEQVDRIARLGCIVSANPYYPVGFADRYGDFGLGPERADTMVRSASVLARRVPLAFHSDLPMAPAEPLALASFAVNRITETGRVAAPEQRIECPRRAARRDDRGRVLVAAGARTGQHRPRQGGHVHRARRGSVRRRPDAPARGAGDRLGLRRALVPGARRSSPRPRGPRASARRAAGVERPVGISRSPSRGPRLLVRSGPTRGAGLAHRRRRPPRRRLTPLRCFGARHR